MSLLFDDTAPRESNRKRSKRRGPNNPGLRRGEGRNARRQQEQHQKKLRERRAKRERRTRQEEALTRVNNEFTDLITAMIKEYGAELVQPILTAVIFAVFAKYAAPDFVSMQGTATNYSKFVKEQALPVVREAIEMYHQDSSIVGMVTAIATAVASAVAAILFGPSLLE